MPFDYTGPSSGQIKICFEQTHLSTAQYRAKATYSNVGIASRVLHVKAGQELS